MGMQAEKTQKDNQSVSTATTRQQNTDTSAFQFADNRPEAIIQRKCQDIANDSPQVAQLQAFQAMADNYSARQQQPVQKKANNTGLPDNLKSGIENLSGYVMDDVKVHYNSSKPAQLQAHAYTQGTDIHVAPGQEQHLPHEAWHVVQQKQGRVKPTLQMKGKVNINDDAGLEKEADVMGEQAMLMNDSLPVEDESSKSLNSGQETPGGVVQAKSKLYGKLKKTGKKLKNRLTKKSRRGRRPNREIVDVGYDMTDSDSDSESISYDGANSSSEEEHGHIGFESELLNSSFMESISSESTPETRVNLDLDHSLNAAENEEDWLHVEESEKWQRKRGASGRLNDVRWLPLTRPAEAPQGETKIPYNNISTDEQVEEETDICSWTNSESASMTSATSSFSELEEYDTPDEVIKELVKGMKLDGNYKMPQVKFESKVKELISYRFEPAAVMEEGLKNELIVKSNDGHNDGYHGHYSIIEWEYAMQHAAAKAILASNHRGATREDIEKAIENLLSKWEGELTVDRVLNYLETNGMITFDENSLVTMQPPAIGLLTQVAAKEGGVYRNNNRLNPAMISGGYSIVSLLSYFRQEDEKYAVTHWQPYGEEMDNTRLPIVDGVIYKNDPETGRYIPAENPDWSELDDKQVHNKAPNWAWERMQKLKEQGLNEKEAKEQTAQEMRKNARLIFVMDEAGNFYAREGQLNDIHHSTFFAQKAVACAGEIGFSAGKPIYLSNASGHYKPGPLHTWQAVHALASSGADISGLKVSMHNVEEDIDGEVFLRNFIPMLVLTGDDNKDVELINEYLRKQRMLKFGLGNIF